MACPIPSDFQDLIIDPNASVCESLSKLGPATVLWYEAYACIYKNNGEFTDEFIAKICATGCGGGVSTSTGGDVTTTTGGGTGTQDYFTPGNFEFTVPAGVTEVTVIVVAGGGAGGGPGSAFSSCSDGLNFARSGGGSGEKRVHTFTVTPAGTVNITVGAGGTPDAVTGNGSAGGSSGAFYGAESVIANGGNGGIKQCCVNGAAAGGTGGSGGSGGTGTSGNDGGTATGYPSCPSTGTGGASVGLTPQGKGGTGSATNSNGTDGGVRISW